MKTLLTIAFLLFVGYSAFASDDDVRTVKHLPRFDTANDWVREMARPSFELVHFVETKKMWYAIFRTSEDNLVWCTHERVEITPCRGIFRIFSDHGPGLRDGDYDPTGDAEPPEQGRNYYTTFKVVDDDGWKIRLRYDGALYGLVKPVPKSFRVKQVLTPKDGSSQIIFDEVINFFESAIVPQNEP